MKKLCLDADDSWAGQAGDEAVGFMSVAEAQTLLAENMRGVLASDAVDTVKRARRAAAGESVSAAEAMIATAVGNLQTMMAKEADEKSAAGVDKQWALDVMRTPTKSFWR